MIICTSPSRIYNYSSEYGKGLKRFSTSRNISVKLTNTMNTNAFWHRHTWTPLCARKLRALRLLLYNWRLLLCNMKKNIYFLSTNLLLNSLLCAKYITMSFSFILFLGCWWCVLFIRRAGKRFIVKSIHWFFQFIVFGSAFVKHIIR